MEKISIEFSEQELKRLLEFQSKDESLESMIKRLLLTYVPDIPPNEWTNHLDKMFVEYEETFEKLAE